MLADEVQWTAWMLVALLLSSGCSARSVYEVSQDYERQQCVKGPPSEYQECIERTNESYDSYIRSKQKAEEKLF